MNDPEFGTQREERRRGRAASRQTNSERGKREERSMMSPEVAAEVLPLTSIKKTPQRYHGCRCHRSAYPEDMPPFDTAGSSSKMWTTTLKIFNAKKRF